MRHRIVCVCHLLPFATFSQITITSDALPSVGDSYGRYYDLDPPPVFTVTPPGPNAQSWDYSTAFDVQDALAVYWVDPSTLPGIEFFPDANLASLSMVSGTGDFYTTNSDGIYLSGYYYSDPDVTDEFHVTDGLYMPTPFTYGSSRSVVRRMTDLLIYANGAPAERKEFYSEIGFVCDAWGTIRTPAYPSGVEVLRIKYTQVNSFDSVFIDASGTGNGPWIFQQRQAFPDVTGYEFVKDWAPYSVMSLPQDLSYASYVSTTVPIGLEEQGEAPRASFAYPVPSHGDVVHIALADPAITKVQIRNAMGQALLTTAVRGVEVLNIATGSWGAGTYTYTCSRGDGSLADHGRFLIVR